MPIFESSGNELIGSSFRFSSSFLSASSAIFILFFKRSLSFASCFFLRSLAFPQSLDLTQKACAAPAGDWDPSLTDLYTNPEVSPP
eukprot:Skav217081  [mRNA]  locus=scaffold1308:97922:98389:+ [translate_table: standard]